MVGSIVQIKALMWDLAEALCIHMMLSIIYCKVRMWNCPQVHISCFVSQFGHIFFSVYSCFCCLLWFLSIQIGWHFDDNMVGRISCYDTGKTVEPWPRACFLTLSHGKCQLLGNIWLLHGHPKWWHFLAQKYTVIKSFEGSVSGRSVFLSQIPNRLGVFLVFFCWVN